MTLTITCDRCKMKVVSTPVMLPIDWHEVVKDMGWEYIPDDAVFLCKDCKEK